MKIKNNYSRIAVIDADFITYIGVHPNKVKDKFNNPIKKDGKFIYYNKTEEEAKKSVDNYLNTLLSTMKADGYILCLTKGKSFRVSIDSTYKENRKKLEKPMHYDAVRQHMVERYKASYCELLEADDMVSIVKNELENVMVVAVDKDILFSTEGKFFDARRGQLCELEVSKTEAEYNFAVSLLTGDLIDNISPVLKGVGPVTAKKELDLRIDLQKISPITAAFNIYIKYLGEIKGVEKFYKHYKLLKIIEKLEDLPENVIFEIPEIQCFNCNSEVKEDILNNYDL